MKKTTTLTFLLSIILATSTLLSACKENSKPENTANNDPVAAAVNELSESFDPKDHPLILRRTTLIVRDIEKSLKLYKDAIGMEIIYDNIIKRKHPTEAGDQEIRLVFLKANHNYFGVLGLVDYEYNKKDKAPKAIRKEGFTAQNSVLLFNTNELEARFPIIEHTPGVEIITAPAMRKYPSYDGKGTIEVMVSTFYDPDGFLVEFNQVLSEFSLN